MATNDVNLQVINSMTQEKMNSLKNSEGKIPSLANQLIMTDEEDANLSQLKIKVLWTNPSPSSSFTSQTITLSSSDYDYLMVVVRTNVSAQYFYSPALIKKGFGGRLSSSDTGTSSNYKIMMQSRDMTRVSDTQYTISDCRYSHDTVAETGRNDLCVPYQILGLKKAPAMIYTGKELFNDPVTAGIIRTGQHDTVSEYYMSSDGKTWYRKWASGWKECGGQWDIGDATDWKNIVLPLAFSNTNYVVQLNPTFSNVSGGVSAGDFVAYIVDAQTIKTRGYNNPQKIYACGF